MKFFEEPLHGFYEKYDFVYFGDEIWIFKNKQLFMRAIFENGRCIKKIKEK